MPGRKASGPMGPWDSGAAERDVRRASPQSSHHFVGLTIKAYEFFLEVQRMFDYKRGLFTCTTLGKALLRHGLILTLSCVLGHTVGSTSRAQAQAVDVDTPVT